ncbi:hypothetical protein Pla100_33060 [Neorhodopirellula pilleata]|uniref:Uncharacterized protein n=1 Tax=Neorhodopirellula pilleata TaxID=2714738 RepID=A0A5C6A8P6_9BACT|nr:hypothetical protein Pla100_33060 [Neorhodopirellula pilleata]
MQTTKMVNDDSFRFISVSFYCISLVPSPAFQSGFPRFSENSSWAAIRPSLIHTQQDIQR